MFHLGVHNTEEVFADTLVNIKVVSTHPAQCHPQNHKSVLLLWELQFLQPKDQESPVGGERQHINSSGGKNSVQQLRKLPCLQYQLTHEVTVHFNSLTSPHHMRCCGLSRLGSLENEQTAISAGVVSGVAG